MQPVLRMALQMVLNAPSVIVFYKLKKGFLPRDIPMLLCRAAHQPVLALATRTGYSALFVAPLLLN